MKKKKIKIKKLSTKILFYLIIPIIILMLFIGYVSINIMTRSTREQIKKEVNNECSQMQSSLYSTFTNLQDAVSSGKTENMARNYVRNLRNPLDYQSSKGYNQLQNAIDHLYMRYSDVVVSTGFIDMKHDLAFSDTHNGWYATEWKASQRPWYQVSSLANDSTYISTLYDCEVFKDSEDEGQQITIVNPVASSDQNEIIGAVVMTLNWNDICSGIYYNEPGSNGSIVLMNYNHQVLFASDSLRGKEELIGDRLKDSRKLTDVSANQAFDITIEKKNYFASYRDVQGVSWGVLAFIPESEVQTRLSVYTLQMSIMYCAGVLIILVMFFVISNTIVSPIKEITRTTKAIAEGNYANKLKVKSADEIGQLASAFNSTIITLRYRADYDELTGIYNSATMFRETEAMLKKHPDNQYAIICMDVNHFKLVNDLKGWEKGDELLKHIAHVLTNKLPHDSIYARVRGDIFCMCVHFEQRSQLIRIVSELRADVEGYYDDIDVAPFFGICVVEDITTPVNVMCDWADMALKSIKGNMVQFYAFYDDQLRDTMIYNKLIESEMYMALEQKQFFVMLQPKCDINTGKAIGAEALVRWQHPERGMIPPDSFIPVFEEDGFVLQLDEYVWEETCKAIRSWLDRGFEVVPVSVNVSRLHILDGELVEKLVNLVKKYSLPTGLLELELTESAFLGNVEELYEIMHRLKDAGFTLSMDDFGSGYSSLNMLKDAPFDVVKFDREFLNETVNSNKGKTILDSMIDMVNWLNIKVLVEGVETEEQTRILLEAGCHIAQGYYYSRPISIEEFEEFAFNK